MRWTDSAVLRASPLLAGLFLIGMLAPAAAQAPALAMLGALEKGQWEFRFRDGGTPGRLCLHNGRELIQLQHPGAPCNRFVVDDGPNEVIVQYTCRGNGYGRTRIRRETTALVQVESQGVAGGMPFNVMGEARKVGACR